MRADPFRPIPGYLRPARLLARWIRRHRLQILLRDRLTLGANVTFGRDAYLAPATLARFGNNVAVGSHFHLEADLEVGDDVLISSRVAIVSRDHSFKTRGVSVYKAGRVDAGKVVLEGDNLIGFGSIIIAPASLGRGCIVGAGAVVTGDLPPDMICVGVPARPIAPRYPDA